MEENKKKRNYSIDTLKFICMLFIIIIHLTGKGGLLNNPANNNLINNIYLVINNLLMIGVNIFCIITGYLYVDKKRIDSKNGIRIIFDMLFYSIVITTIFYILNLYNIRSYGIGYIIDCIFTSRIGRYWFVTCYIFMFFLIPYINIIIEKINKSEQKKLIIFFFILICIIQEIFMYDLFRIKWGYSPFWLMYLYLIGAYEKKYGINIDKKMTTILFITILCINMIVVTLTQNILKSNNIYYYLGEHYTSPTIVISSILFFHIFIKTKFRNNLLATMGKYSLAVIIIHGHRLIYDFIINNRMTFIIKYNLITQLLIITLIATVIYIACVIIEKLKNKIYLTFKIEKIIEKISNKINEVLEWKK